MNKMDELKTKETQKFSGFLKRRSFLKYAGASAGITTLALTACDEDDDGPNDGVDLGIGDTAILNYAYTLEQLEAAFYTMVASHSEYGTIFTVCEQAILTDIRDHEIIHRDFFKTALAGNAIPDLEFDFTSINFANRESVLNTAKTFEDLGVSAYNGAGNLLQNGNLLLVAGKIVSVEARHAAAIRDLLNPKSADFAGDDVVNATGLDVAKMPLEVLMAAAPFIKTKINSSNLPTG